MYADAIKLAVQQRLCLLVNIPIHRGFTKVSDVSPESSLFGSTSSIHESVIRPEKRPLRVLHGAPDVLVTRHTNAPCQSCPVQNPTTRQAGRVIDRVKTRSVVNVVDLLFCLYSLDFRKSEHRTPALDSFALVVAATSRERSAARFQNNSNVVRLTRSQKITVKSWLPNYESGNAG